jgi:hypothetical protein
MATNKSTTSTTVPAQAREISDVMKVSRVDLTCCLVGDSPLIQNRLSEKVKHELLMPKGKKNAAERATTLKHDPIAEYRSSPYTIRDEAAPTFLALPSVSFKGALRSAALDMPGMKKAQIGRLTYLPGEMVGIYGVPQLFMRPVRSADMNRTPDIRTRAILPVWACRLTIRFVEPLIRPQAILNLLAAAGITIGVGDWRSEKGSGNYGQFRITQENDPEFQAIVKAGGRAAQIDGIEEPTCYDPETEELFTWYQAELPRRQMRGVA